jgi:hypothetical protein
MIIYDETYVPYKRADPIDVFNEWKAENAPLFAQAAAAIEVSNQQSAQIADLLDCIKNMQHTITAANSQIAVMEGQIADMQEIQKHPVKSILSNIHDNLKSCLERAQESLKNLMDKVVDGCKKIVEAAKETGIIAKDNVAEFFEIKDILSDDNKIFGAIDQLCEKAVRNTETFFAEADKMGGHMKNMARALVGKETLEVGDKQPGLLAKFFSAPYTDISSVCKSVISHNDRTIENLNNRTERADAIREHRDVEKNEKSVVKAVNRDEKNGDISKEAANELRTESKSRVEQSGRKKGDVLKRLAEKTAQSKRNNAERNRQNDRKKSEPELA